MILAEEKKKKKKRKKNHLKTMYYNDTLFKYFQIFLTNKLLHWNVSQSLCSNRITLSKGKANILSKYIYIIYRTSSQNVNWKSYQLQIIFCKEYSKSFHWEYHSHSSKRLTC